MIDPLTLACDDCGGVNPVWFAPNTLWNRVMGGPEATDDPGGYICPGCFIARAEAAGVSPTAWQLAPEVAAWNQRAPKALAAEERLGSEFEKVWDDNADALFEATPLAAECKHTSAKYPIDPDRPGHCNTCGAEVFPADQATPLTIAEPKCRICNDFGYYVVAASTVDTERRVTCQCRAQGYITAPKEAQS